MSVTRRLAFALSVVLAVTTMIVLVVVVNDGDTPEPRNETAFDGTIAGIRIGPTVTPGTSCGVLTHTVPLESAVGTDLDVYSAYLPTGAVFASGQATTCGDYLLAAEASYDVPEDSSARTWGGPLQIFRFHGALSFQGTFPSERMREGKVAGRDAAVLSPITDDGTGPAAIFIRDDDGVTVIRANGLRLSELKKVAEGLYE